VSDKEKSHKSILEPTKHEFRATDPFAKPGATAEVTPANTALPPEEYLTEKEQDALAGGNGVGPITPSEESPPLETMEDLDIGPADPYPEGAPPAAPEATTRKGRK
jgi:hypothetical protein